MCFLVHDLLYQKGAGNENRAPLNTQSTSNKNASRNSFFSYLRYSCPSAEDLRAWLSCRGHGGGTTMPRNPDTDWHQAQQMGTPPCPCQLPASPGPSSASPPSSHTFPHLSRAEPDLRIISANKQKSGSMTMYFVTLVSQIPPTG